MHGSRPDGLFWGKVWFALAGVSILSGLFRIFYYQERRDYFSEEMDHRRSLAKDPTRLSAKG